MIIINVKNERNHFNYGFPEILLLPEHLKHKKMKPALINRLMIGFFVSFPLLSLPQETHIRNLDKPNKLDKPSQYLTMNESKFQGKYFWGDINAGYANHGPAGSASLNFRNGKLLFSSQYNKSHTCVEDHAHGENISLEEMTETHLTVESISLLSGIA